LSRANFAAAPAPLRKILPGGINLIDAVAVVVVVL